VAERTLNHFSFFAFSDAYWSLAGAERAEFARTWLPQLRGSAEQVAVYQVFPAQAGADILVWSALPAETPEAAGTFFSCYARAVNAQRRLLQPVETLWGFTRPSVYARGQSAQEIDPLAAERQPYLIVYPFVKTKEWYLMSRDARQGMMNEHIRVGHQYPEIKQLLLYSFGLQAQEFVVVYETANLAKFSDLVNELRSVEGRRYTERDTPAHTAIYHPAEETLALFGGAA
jgi:chlorite dismutase